MKPSRHKPYSELHPMPIPDMPWDVMSVDFISELPDAHGYDAICEIVDCFGVQVWLGRFVAHPWVLTGV